MTRLTLRLEQQDLQRRRVARALAGLLRALPEERREACVERDDPEAELRARQLPLLAEPRPAGREGV